MVCSVCGAVYDLVTGETLDEGQAYGRYVT
jgi:rubredoxin